MQSRNYRSLSSPLVHSLFVHESGDYQIAPGSSRYIITEDVLKILTENRYYLVTEN